MGPQAPHARKRPGGAVALLGSLALLGAVALPLVALLDERFVMSDAPGA